MAGCSGSRTSSAKKNSRHLAQGSVSFSSYYPPCYGVVTACPCSELILISKSLQPSCLCCAVSVVGMGHSPARCGSDKTGPVLVTALARGSKIESYGGTLNGDGATLVLQQKPSCASLLVAPGIDLQSSRPVLASQSMAHFVLVLQGPRAMDSRSIPQDRGRHVREQATSIAQYPCLEA